MYAKDLNTSISNFVEVFTNTPEEHQEVVLHTFLVTVMKDILKENEFYLHNGKEEQTIFRYSISKDSQNPIYRKAIMNYESFDCKDKFLSVEISQFIQMLCYHLGSYERMQFVFDVLKKYKLWFDRDGNEMFYFDGSSSNYHLWYRSGGMRNILEDMYFHAENYMSSCRVVKSFTWKNQKTGQFQTISAEDLFKERLNL